jgi:membrane-associated phospholipid phosphatase
MNRIIFIKTERQLQPPVNHKVLRNSIFFLLPYSIVLVISIAVLLQYSKADIHLFLNQFHSDFFDLFFCNITFLGDGLFIIPIAVLLLFHSLRSTVYLVTAYLSTGLVAQLLKRFIFEDCARPVKYFHDQAALHLVNGVQMLSGHSFPSGHATSAFTLFLGLSLISRNKFIQIACFLLACIVAYSRVYLSQHFLADIVAGSLIGTLGTLGFYKVFYRQDRKWHKWSPQKIYGHEKSR